MPTMLESMNPGQNGSAGVGRSGSAACLMSSCHAWRKSGSLAVISVQASALTPLQASSNGEGIFMTQLAGHLLATQQYNTQQVTNALASGPARGHTLPYRRCDGKPLVTSMSTHSLGIQRLFTETCPARVQKTWCNCEAASCTLTCSMSRMVSSAMNCRSKGRRQ